MMLHLEVESRSWLLREPFAISRGVQTTCDVIIVHLSDGSLVGRGEAAGIPYAGETPETMAAQIEAVRSAIEAGCNRRDLCQLLPVGGARNALDAALWDLEAKRSDTPAWQLAGIPTLRLIDSMVTIGIRSLADYEERARALRGFAWLKVKVGADDPLAAIAAVRRGAPDSRLLVDPNQAWSIGDLFAYADRLRELGVDILEQPVRVEDSDALAGIDYPITICADEAANDIGDLPRLIGRYQMVNIKLDKTGGLTTALELAREARAAGLRLMVGCMVGGSVAMAPAMVLAQQCEVADLDGPLLQAEDWPDAIAYEHGRMSWPLPSLWG